jgi:PAS domain S-box-containing protein
VIPEPANRPEQSSLEILSALSYRTGALTPYLQDVAQGLSQLISLDWSVVTLCREGEERILASTIDLGDAGNQVYALHGTVTGTVIERGAPLTVENVATCPDYGEGPAGYQAYLGVPLRTPAGKVIGTICSFQRQPRSFTPADVRLAEIFAERAATAIDNYQLYQQQQQVNVQLHAEIRDRQAAEQSLRQSEEKFRQLAENMNQVVWMRDRDGSPLYLSPAFEGIWGHPCPAWYDDPSIWWQTVHPEDRHRVQTAFAQADPGTFEAEYRLVRPDGTVRIIRDQSFPIRDATGKIYRIAGIAEDITIRKQSEQEMVKAIASLAEVGELATMIVHEIRNPLTTVIMGLNSFKRLQLPEGLQERLTLALEEAGRLRNLLNEILTYAKPQMLQHSPVDLNGFITEILEPIRLMPSAISRRIEFIPATQAITVSGDKDKLRQVFINLIDNACEAVAAGEVITWTIVTESSTNRVLIQVHNQGDPVPSEYLEKLTKPFYTTKSSGTGLGLAIVKRIVEAHGGTLAIASSVLHGTMVSVCLPLSG